MLLKCCCNYKQNVLAPSHTSIGTLTPGTDFRKFDVSLALLSIDGQEQLDKDNNVQDTDRLWKQISKIVYTNYSSVSTTKTKCSEFIFVPQNFTFVWIRTETVLSVYCV